MPRRRRIGHAPRGTRPRRAPLGPRRACCSRRCSGPGGPGACADRCLRS
ncbi:hypothetical protein ACFPRL_04400 [Pseudoclavibacter helvolus]